MICIAAISIDVSKMLKYLNTGEAPSFIMKNNNCPSFMFMCGLVLINSTFSLFMINQLHIISVCVV